MPAESRISRRDRDRRRGCHKDPALLQAIATAELAFVVDPIVGTRNFTANLPLLAAPKVCGEIVAGVIYDPVCQAGPTQRSEPEPGSSTKMVAGSLCGWRPRSRSRRDR